MVVISGSSSAQNIISYCFHNILRNNLLWRTSITAPNIANCGRNNCFISDAVWRIRVSAVPIEWWPTNFWIAQNSSHFLHYSRQSYFTSFFFAALLLFVNYSNNWRRIESYIQTTVSNGVQNTFDNKIQHGWSNLLLI